jgi:SAM-dependent methyltransferase
VPPDLLVALDAPPACFCGGTSYEPVLEGRYDRLGATGYPFRIVCCRACGLARTLPVPDSKQYAQGFTLSTCDERFTGQVDDSWSERIVGAVAHEIPHGRLLDVGCHAGSLVAAASARGFDAEGIDLDPYATQAGRQLGRPLRTGSLEDVDGTFDAIVANHVLEHVHDLGSFFANLARLLAPGGRAFLFSPCCAGLPARVMHERWMGWFPQQHVWHFTPETLTRVVEASRALRVVRCTTRGVIEPPSAGAKGRVKALVAAAARGLHRGDQVEAVIAPREATAGV